jgi:hypothetical protein
MTTKSHATQNKQLFCPRRMPMQPWLAGLVYKSQDLKTNKNPASHNASDQETMGYARTSEYLPPESTIGKQYI